MRTQPLLAAVTAVATTAVLAAVGGLATATPASARGDAARVFVPSAVVNADHTATLPLHRGRLGSQTVWYVITEASDSNHAAQWGASVSQKLRNARGTAAVQKVRRRPGRHRRLPGDRRLLPDPRHPRGPLGFPPAAAAPGAVGDAGYSPLIQLPDGAVLNAPSWPTTPDGPTRQSGSTRRGTVRYALTDGFSRGNAVVYLSTESSDPGAAAIEDVTYAPSLNAAPFAGGDGTDSAARSLAAFTNGPDRRRQPAAPGSELGPARRG